METRHCQQVLKVSERNFVPRWSQMLSLGLFILLIFNFFLMIGFYCFFILLCFMFYIWCLTIRVPFVTLNHQSFYSLIMSLCMCKRACVTGWNSYHWQHVSKLAVFYLLGAEFTNLNQGMEKTGTFTMKCKKIFQLVGKTNSNLADVILKLGLFERSDVAWKNAKYAQIWEYLRDEYKLTQRFGSLDYKLKFVEHNEIGIEPSQCTHLLYIMNGNRIQVSLCSCLYEYSNRCHG